MDGKNQLISGYVSSVTRGGGGYPPKQVMFNKKGDWWR